MKTNQEVDLCSGQRNQLFHFFLQGREVSDLMFFFFFYGFFFLYFFMTDAKSS